MQALWSMLSQGLDEHEAQSMSLQRNAGVTVVRASAPALSCCSHGEGMAMQNTVHGSQQAGRVRR